jgi:RNA polymerase sigma-70 factor, ECF subfamily
VSVPVFDEAFWREARRVVLTRILTASGGQQAQAEDAVQEAIASAQQHWLGSAPAEPVAWLTLVARRKLVDAHRTEARQSALGVSAAQERSVPQRPQPAVSDERLRLFFGCCHPSLDHTSQVALALRSVGGLGIPEISRRLLLSPSAVEKRLGRARRKVRDADIPMRVPTDEGFAERLQPMLAVLSVYFAEGLAPTRGEDPFRLPLCDAAIGLARLLYSLLPGNGEVAGLLAVMLLHDARRTSRVDEAGAIVPFEKQDRARWDLALIEEGLDLTLISLEATPLSAFTVQALIAATHAEAQRYDLTDWHTLARLHRRWFELSGSPTARVGEAVAVLEGEGVEASAPLIDALEDLVETPTLGAVVLSLRSRAAARSGDQTRAAGYLAAALDSAVHPSDRAALERQQRSLVDLCQTVSSESFGDGT